ncbi:3'-5' exoribonuclease HELZ2-like [Ptychodera flava]|uniref:3'-5' exoribonuclease HELZ2-like n=1 Tax=Ptychodera flava TaxID=63121 RepID=UPI00396AA802
MTDELPLECQRLKSEGGNSSDCLSESQLQVKGKRETSKMLTESGSGSFDEGIDCSVSSRNGDMHMRAEDHHNDASSLAGERAQCPYEMTVVCLTCWMRDSQLFRRSTRQPDYCSNPREPRPHPWNRQNKAFLVKTQKHGSYKWVQVRPLIPNATKLHLAQICKFTKDCKQDKQCPYPHSNEEARLWSFQLRCNVTSEEDLEALTTPLQRDSVTDILRQRHDSGTSMECGKERLGSQSPHTPEMMTINIVENHEPVGIFCDLCRGKEFHAQRDLYAHYKSQQHLSRQQEDNDRVWKFRAPPWSVKDPGQLTLCPSFHTGTVPAHQTLCGMAHSEEELHEWKERVAYRRMKLSQKESKDMLFLRQIIETFDDSESEPLSVMVEDTSDCRVVLLGKHHVHLQATDGHPFQHSFNFETDKGQRNLQSVGLLLDPCRSFFSIKEASTPGGTGGRQVASASDIHAENGKYHITVSFTTDRQGIYNQWVIFDFGEKPVVVKRLLVTAGSIADLTTEGHLQHDGILVKAFNKPLVDVFRHRAGVTPKGPLTPRRYRHPLLQCQMISWWDYEDKTNSPWSLQSNIRRSLCLQAIEEEDMLSRFEFKGEISRTTDENNKEGIDGETGLLISITGGTISGSYIYRLYAEGIFENIAIYMEDVQDCDPYYGKIRHRKNSYSDSVLYIEMMERFVQEMGLTRNSKLEIVCKPLLNVNLFNKLNYWSDTLHGNTVFQNLEFISNSADISQGSIYGLNLDRDQTKALLRMCDDSKKKFPPVILCGPTGSGKSLLFDVAAAVLMRKCDTNNDNNKLLICTNSFSCAMVHLSNVLYYLRKSDMHHIRPVVIVPNDRVLQQSVDCELNSFLTTIEDYVKANSGRTVHKIVITTMRGSVDLLCTEGHLVNFSHVFIDEAGLSNACWAIPPLSVAGNGARMVIAGNLNNCEVCESLSGTILDELIRAYCLDPMENDSVIYLHNSYRSSDAIVNYVNSYLHKEADVHYVDNSVLSMVIPMTRGDEASMKDLKRWQILGALYHIEHLCHTWPDDFGEYRTNGMCIIVEDENQMENVKLELLNRDLSSVSVEDSNSVAGREFTVVLFMLAIEGYRFMHKTCYKMVFAGAMSRAKRMFTLITSPDWKSHCVSGDERSLVLGNYFKYCFMQYSILSVQQVRAVDFGLEEKFDQQWSGDNTDLEEDGCDSHQQRECVQESSFGNDMVMATEDSSSPDSNLEKLFFPHPRVLTNINAEFENDRRGMNTDWQDGDLYTEEDDDVDDYDDNYYEDDDFEGEEYNPEIHDPPPDRYGFEKIETEKALFEEYTEEKCLELLQSQPEKYKRCRIETRIQDKDKAVPIGEELDFEIVIPNKQKRGRALGQDIVVIELIDEDEQDEEEIDDIQTRYGCVVGILKRHEDPRYKEVLCTLDEFSDSIMVPINGNFPKMIWWKNQKGSCTVDDMVHIPLYKISTKGRHVFSSFEDVDNASRPYKIFITRFLRWDINKRYPTCIVTGVLPEVKDLESGLKYLKAKYDIRENFGKPQKTGHTTRSSPRRKDLRHLQVFTIDPKDAKDLDDALSVRQLDNGNFELGVHISDVASQVPRGSQLDDAAYKQGTSFYPPGEHIPMFPKLLSTNHFSILPSGDKDTISFLFEVDQDGNVTEMREVTRSLINSKCQLSYEDAESIILQKNEDEGTVIEVQVLQLHKLAQERRKKRLGKSYFLTESNSYDEEEENAPLSHQLVEELMIIVNTEVAEWLLKVYPDRVPIRRQLHPAKEKLDKWSEAFADFLQCSVKLSSKIDPPQKSSTKRHIKVLKAFGEILEEQIEKGNFEKVKQLLCDDSNYPELFLMALKFNGIQNRAEYHCSDPHKKSEHFELKTNAYIRCTSPIRRYMDLIVQRIILARLDALEAPYNKEELNAICASCNQAEDKQASFHKDCRELKLALKLQENPVKAYAIVDEAGEASVDLQVMGNMDIPRKDRKMPMGLLKVSDKPVVNNGELKLRWNERVYDCGAREEGFTTVSSSSGRVIHLQRNHHFISEDTDRFKGFLRYFLRNDKDMTKQFVERIQNECEQYRSISKHNEVVTSERLDCKGNRLDPCMFTRPFKSGDVLRVQIGTQRSKGSTRPCVDLVRLAPGVDICKEHRTDPVRCFSEIASKKIPSLEKRKQMSISEYKKAWLPVLAMSAVDNSIRKYENYTIDNVEIEWKSTNCAAGLMGQFSLLSSFCESRNIKFISYMHQESHDYACVRYQPCNRGDSVEWESGKMVDKNFCWIGHCIITGVRTFSEKDEDGYVEVTIQLQQTNNNFLHSILEAKMNSRLSCTIEIVQKATPDRRAEEAIHKMAQPSTSDLAKNICLGQPTSKQIPRGCSIRQVLLKVAKGGDGNFRHINEDQTNAIRKALEQEFTVIQGPPGTGKSFTAAFLANAFTIVNREEENHSSDKVLYCAPSNKAVDVAAEYLKIFDLNVIRMYSRSIEDMEYPVKGRTDRFQLRQGRQVESNPAHASIALHRVIRQGSSKYGAQISEFEATFRRGDAKVSEEKYQQYKSLIHKAQMEALRECDIILCTCSEAASRRLKDISIRQCIIDEAGMCTEPETLVPLARTNPEQVVLIGDHRQLQPIVSHHLSKQLGLAVSLLERYCLVNYYVKLRKQYRMHPGICEFPNNTFYDGELETAQEVLLETAKRRRLDNIWPGGSDNPIVFCHVFGKEVTLTVTNEEGSEQSKKNIEEAKQVVRITKVLTGERFRVPKSRLQILSQYNSQCFEIKNELKASCESCKKPKHKRKSSGPGCHCADVNTVNGFQGSEKDIVIISTVRSLPRREIEENPTKGWLKKNLGFVTDDHQTNVALTRAKRGVIIIGNKDLLKTDPTWNALIKYYEARHCLVSASSFLSGGHS